MNTARLVRVYFFGDYFFLILRSPLTPAEQPAGGFLVLGDRELKVQARQETSAGVLVHLNVHVVVTLETKQKKPENKISSNSNDRLENQSTGCSCLLECSH